ncbi:hypothetical protein GNI_049390, partial [Gregarina niphandrodes]
MGWDYVSGAAEFGEGVAASLSTIPAPEVRETAKPAAAAPAAEESFCSPPELKLMLEREVACGQKGWLLGRSVMLLKERLLLCYRQQYLKHSLHPSVLTYNQASLHFQLSQAFHAKRWDGVQALTTAGYRIQEDTFARKSDSGTTASALRQSETFLAGIWADDEVALRIVLSSLALDDVLAHAFCKLNIARFIQAPNPPKETCAAIMAAIVGDLSGTYETLENALNAKKVLKRHQRTIVRGALVFLSETLTLLVQFIVDCAKAVLMPHGNDVEETRLEQLARMLTFGVSHVDSVLVNMIRTGHTREVRLVLELVVNRSGTLSQKDRQRLLQVLLGSSDPLLTRLTKEGLTTSALEEGMKETIQARKVLAQLFRPVIDKISKDALGDLLFDYNFANAIPNGTYTSNQTSPYAEAFLPHAGTQALMKQPKPPTTMNRRTDHDKLAGNRPFVSGVVSPLPPP